MHDEIHKYVNLWDEKMNVSNFLASDTWDTGSGSNELGQEIRPDPVKWLVQIVTLCTSGSRCLTADLEAGP